MKNLRVSAEPNASSPPQPRMSDELPLDINFNSAIDWLTQRRVVPAAWQKAMRAVQARRAGAALDIDFTWQGRVVCIQRHLTAGCL